jgi:Zn-dependent protease with chaperone function
VLLRLPFTAYTLPPDKLAKAIEYARARNRLYFIAAAYGIAVLAAILYSGLGVRYRDWARKVSRRRILQAYVVGPLLLLTIDLLNLPVAMRYHQLAVRYEQSIQPWGPWLGDWAKGEAIELAAAGFLVWLLFALVRCSPRRWWFYAWLAAIPLQLFDVFLNPLLVDPLFYRFTPLSDTRPALTTEIEKVMKRGGLEIPRDRIFEMSASQKLKSVNAYVTGIWSSRRVVVWDTTLRTLTTPQTLFVFGHEMGHYVLRHVWLWIALSSAGILAMLFLAYLALPRCGVRLDDYASLPALLLAAAIFGFFADPVANSIARAQEHNADIYGLEVIHDLVPNSREVAAEAFQILGEIGLADPSPSPLIEFWLYSHPSVSKRVRFASEYDPWSQGRPRKYVQ